MLSNGNELWITPKVLDFSQLLVCHVHVEHYEHLHVNVYAKSNDGTLDARDWKLTITTYVINVVEPNQRFPTQLIKFQSDGANSGEHCATT